MKNLKKFIDDAKGNAEAMLYLIKQGYKLKI
jgi:hypothetical protein